MALTSISLAFPYLNFLKSAFCPEAELTIEEESCSFYSLKANISLSEPSTIARFMCAGSPLLPACPLQKAEVSQWLALAPALAAAAAAADGAGALAEADALLAGRSFLVGEAFSLADLALYACAAPRLAAMSSEQMKDILNFSRWFDQAQNSARAIAGSASAELLPALVDVAIHTALVVPRAPKSAGPGAATAGKNKHPPAAAAAAAGGGGGGATEAAAAELAPEQRAKADKKVAKKQAKKEEKAKAKKEKKEAKAKGGNEQANEKKAGGNLDAGNNAAAAAGEFPPSALDIRVGQITKVWEHPEAEKLFCEEIDIGEGSVRSICSGLRPFYKLSELENQRVIVLANLKGRNMVGFKSTGMVMCSSNEDHTEVKLVHPPADAKVGERVSFEGLEGDEPLAPGQVAKKKVFEKLAPFLETDSEGKAMFRNKDVKLYFKAGSGICSSELANGHVA